MIHQTFHQNPCMPGNSYHTNTTLFWMFYLCCVQTQQHIFSSCCCGMDLKWSARRCCQLMILWCVAVSTSQTSSRSTESLAVSNSRWRFTPWSVEILHQRNQRFGRNPLTPQIIFYSFIPFQSLPEHKLLVRFIGWNLSKQRELTALDRRHMYYKGYSSRDLNHLQ